MSGIGNPTRDIGDCCILDSVDEDDDRDDDEAASPLIQAFADLVRSAASGERVAPAGPESLLTLADAARYLAVSTTTVRNLAVGGKVRSTRVGDRIRFRRVWLDEWIDAGGGEVPVPPPAPRPAPTERVVTRPVHRPVRRRAEPKPKPPTFIQKVGDQELRLLADATGVAHTWHIGVQTPLCEKAGRWQSRLERRPHGYMCKACMTALAAMPEADLLRFGIKHAFMLRLSYRGKTATPIRAGYHAGDGRRTLCGKKDGPWALTERAPGAKQCFVCDHRTRWNGRDRDPDSLGPRPVTPLRVLVDAGPLDPRLTRLIEEHPTALDAKQAKEPLTKDAVWSTEAFARIEREAERIGQFNPPKGTTSAPAAHWNTFTISENPDVTPITTAMALERLPDWADSIERALVLYAKWAKASAPTKSTTVRRIG